MDFEDEVRALLDQIPAARAATCGELARALGDPRAAAAVFRFLRDHPDLPGVHRVVTEGGRPLRRGQRRRMRHEGWSGKASSYVTDFRSDAPLARLRAEQVALAAEVSRRNGFRTARTVGGVDVAYAAGRGFASLVVLRPRDFAVVEEVFATREVDFPYIPTYLAYREWPFVEAAFRRLREPPTVLLVDGHGQLHPARCGLACMVGVRLAVPTIGVAKSRLVGTVDARRDGTAAPVRWNGRVLGYAVRTGASVKPLFVSVGHRVAPRTAVRLVRDLCRNRLPEPLRLAHARATEWKRRQTK